MASGPAIRASDIVLSKPASDRLVAPMITPCLIKRSACSAGNGMSRKPVLDGLARDTSPPCCHGSVAAHDPRASDARERGARCRGRENWRSLVPALALPCPAPQATHCHPSLSLSLFSTAERSCAPPVSMGRHCEEHSATALQRLGAVSSFEPPARGDRRDCRVLARGGCEWPQIT